MYPGHPKTAFILLFLNCDLPNYQSLNDKDVWLATCPGEIISSINTGKEGNGSVIRFSVNQIISPLQAI